MTCVINLSSIDHEVMRPVLVERACKMVSDMIDCNITLQSSNRSYGGETQELAGC